MSMGSRRPSRDTGPIAAAVAAILVGQLAVILLLDSSHALRSRGDRVFVGVVLLASVLVTVAAAVVSFLSYLEWYSGRPFKRAPSVHTGASVAVAVSAGLVTLLGLVWILSAQSIEVLMGTSMLGGALAMVVVAVDVIRSR